jgi:hypothetical protein
MSDASPSSASPSFQPRTALFRLLIASLLLIGVGSLLIAHPATAQNGPAVSADDAVGPAPAVTGQVSVGGVAALPRGGLQRNIGPGGGLRLSIGGWTGEDLPLLVGVDFGFFGYGRTTEEVPFSSTVGPRLPVEVTTNNSVLQTHLSVRLQPRRGRFRPYAEALAGFKYLFTRTSIEESGLDGDSGSDIADETNFDDFALSGGAGAGLDIRVFQQKSAKKSVQAVSLHLGVQYLLGQEAEYLAEGDLEDVNGNGRLDRSEMDVRRSRTTFLQPQFGVTIQLSDVD